MDHKEFAAFAMAIRTYYPKEQLLPNQAAMELWHRELQDIPANVAELALRKWVATQKWSPSIAELRELCATITQGESMTWGEAWEKALEAVRRFGSYRQGEALASLDPLTRRCVKHLGFRDLCASENITADRANFRMIYETLQKREETQRQLAAPVREAIAALQLRSLDDHLLPDGSGGPGLRQIGGVTQ